MADSKGFVRVSVVEPADYDDHKVSLSSSYLLDKAKF